MASLSNLVEDLLLNISDKLDLCDIRALASTCKKVYPILIKQLYLVDIRRGRCYALWWGARYNVMGTLMRTLELGANPNQFLPHGVPDHWDWQGKTPLIIASYNQCFEAVQCLLRHGADSNLNSIRWEITALVSLIRGINRRGSGMRFLATMDALLSAGADPNTQNDTSCSFPLYLSIWGPMRIPVEATRLLLSHGAVALRGKYRPCDETWLNILFSFLHRRGEDAVDDDVAAKIDLVLKYHAKSLSPVAWRRPLYTFLSSPNPDTKRLLAIALRRGCDPNTICFSDMWVRGVKPKDVAIRVLFNSTIYAKTHRTLDSNHSDGVDMLRMLLRAGADPNFCDEEDEKDDEIEGWGGGMTALTFLAQKGTPQVKKSVLARLDISRLAQSVLSRICSRIPKPKPQHDEFWDLLLLMLLKHGASPGIPCLGSGMTPLHYVCAETKVSEQRVKWLLQYGADVRVKDCDERTAYEILSWSGKVLRQNSGVAKLLLRQ